MNFTQYEACANGAARAFFCLVDAKRLTIDLTTPYRRSDLLHIRHSTYFKTQLLLKPTLSNRQQHLVSTGHKPNNAHSMM